MQRALLPGGLLALAIAGCAATPGPGEHSAADKPLRERFAARGYERAAAPVAGQTFNDHWTLDGASWPISARLPQHDTGQPLPVVLYQPDRRDEAATDEGWMNAWAGAGYAVLRLPAVADDIPPAERRAQWSRWLAELTRRSAAGEGWASRLDARRIVLAGHGGGARGALAMVGERDTAETPPPAPAAIRGAIALEPTGIPASGGLASRFDAIARPVLSIARGERSFDRPSREDMAPRGSGSRGAPPGSPGGRTGERRDEAAGAGKAGPDRPPGEARSVLAQQAPFRFMPPGSKYLLVLAGDDAAPRAAERPVRPGGRDEQRNRRPPLGDIAAEQVSLAFLDAHLGDDPVAREWLERNAERWLAVAGRWESK